MNPEGEVEIFSEMNAMNRCFLLMGLLGISTSPLMAQNQKGMNQPMRDPVRHEDLSNKLRMAQQKDPIRNMGPAAGKVDEDPSQRTTSRDLIKESTVLCHRGFLTLVPKQAVLHQPDSLKDRFEAKDQVKVQTWADFFAANRGWIRTQEVSREQAMGLAPLPEGLMETFKGSQFVVVATFKGGPISVLPYQDPAQEAAENASPLTSPATQP